MLASRGVTAPRHAFLLIMVLSFLILTYLSLGPAIYNSANGGAQRASSKFATTDKEIYEQHDDNSPWEIPYSTDSPDNVAIANTTLGFQAIYVLGLPDRLLKRDSMELGASVTNLNLTWMDGVFGNQMHPKAIPPSRFDPNGRWFTTDSEVGCWRGHMNIIHKMVKERISTALIMEDDADWDVHIVQQLQQFANVSRNFLSEDPNSTWRRKRRSRTGSPYGEGWDILWVGHCGGFQAEDRNNHVGVVYNDSTVPPAYDIKGQLFGIDEKEQYKCSAQDGVPAAKDLVCDSPRLLEDQRVIQERTSPLCTTGYAISLQGARKMLARLGGLSLLDVTGPVDQEMIRLCKGNGNEGAEREAARCLTVSPAYIRTHRAKGPFSGDSDIEDHGNGMREVGLSEGLVYPTRLNVENLIAGYEPESQYVRDEDGTWRYKTKDEYRSLP